MSAKYRQAYRHKNKKCRYSCHPLAVTPSCCLAVTPSHCLAVTPSRCHAVSLSCRLTVSPSHCLAVSPSRRLTVCNLPSFHMLNSSVTVKLDSFVEHICENIFVRTINSGCFLSFYFVAKDWAPASTPVYWCIKSFGFCHSPVNMYAWVTCGSERAWAGMCSKTDTRMTKVGRWLNLWFQTDFVSILTVITYN